MLLAVADGLCASRPRCGHRCTCLQLHVVPRALGSSWRWPMGCVLASRGRCGGQGFADGCAFNCMHPIQKS